MKKISTISILVALAMSCSCQKRDSAAEQQLAKRKAELDARETAFHGQEKALRARERALAETERALAEKEQAMAKGRALNPELQGQTFDAVQAKAERDRRIEQLPPEVRALIPDPPEVNSEKPAQAVQK